MGFFDHLVDFRLQILEDEPAGRLESAVQVNGGHQGLKNVRQQIGRHHRVDDHAFAEKQKFSEVQQAANASAGAPANDHRLDLGKVPFLIFGKALKELFAGDQAQHGVAQEFQAFVGGQAGVGTGGVRQRGAQKLRLAKLIADRFLGHDLIVLETGPQP